jgi:1-acyl-sn-glycerol-3-phosphate acyltransferase
MNLRTILGNTIAGAAMVFLTPFGLIALVMRFAGLGKASSFFIYTLARLWARLMIVISGVDLTVTGREHIPAKGPLCFASNHTGAFDIIILLAHASRPFGFIAKKELAFIPFLNLWILLLGGLFIDRKNPRSALGTISKGVARIKKGEAMLIFPEGTRSRGQGLLPFRPGAFKLAVRSRSALLPVAISGGFEIFEKEKKFIPGRVSLSFAPPLDFAHFDRSEGKHELPGEVYRIIDEMLKTR